MRAYISTFIGFLFIQNFTLILSSPGDQSTMYRNCVKKCVLSTCADEDGISYNADAARLQDIWCRLTQWSCRDECQYSCMWRTVEAFKERGYATVKFHGKWPFKRLLGVQEPASMFCSILNLLAHVYMGHKIYTDPRFSSKSTLLLRFWFVFIAVNINGWIWSTIFHTRDTPFTEFMDYSCALSMVMAFFVASVVRSFYTYLKSVAVVLLFTVLYFTQHVWYLVSGVIDYDFNMKVNVFFGVLGGLVWVLWSVSALYRWGSATHYVWRLLIFNILTCASLLLELIDFPPLAHTWDAHAFWHLTTAPLPLLFYRYVIDDLAYLQTFKTSVKTALKFA